MIFKDNYEWLSGWIHDYFCDKDGAELLFDLNHSDYFVCPVCHFKYTDIKRKRAWITKYRYQLFALLEEYSKQYLETRKEELLHFINDALAYYSSNYSKFAVHNKDGDIFDTIDNHSNNFGRITSQGLNEAMIGIRVVHCLHHLGPYLDVKIKEDVFELLFFHIYELLKPQINKIHNICCYEMCAIGMMGIVSNNKEMLEFAFHSAYSFYNQIDKGVSKDYFWFEGSFHYHFFVLKPILELLMFAKEYRFSIPEKYYGIGRKMLRQGFLCSFRDCSLPSPNDGWPNRQLGDYLEDYTLGNALYNGEFFPMINNISTKVNPTGTVHCVESGFSLLKNEYWEVFIKYKDNNVSHAHPDKLNVEVKTCNCFLTHDLSTSGYGSDISRDFYKKSCAHNTVVIDGKEQNLECDVVVTFCDENVIEIQTKNIYQNVNISRKVQLLSKTFIDEVLVDGCFQSVDSIFHCDAKLLTKLDFNKERRFEEYPYFKNVCGVACKEDSLILEWELDDKVIVSKIDLKNKELYIGTSPDNPNLKDRTTLIIRSFAGVKIAYKIEWYCR